MNTKIAALAVLLMTGAAPAALAQDQGDHHHERQDAGGGRPAEQHAGRPQQAPQFQRPAPQGPQFQPRPAPQAPGGGQRWHGGPPAGAPQAGPPAGGWQGQRGGDWRQRGPGGPQPGAPAQPHDWRGDRGGQAGQGGQGGRPPQVDSWSGRGPSGDRNGYRGGDPGRGAGDRGQWSRGGDPGRWNGGGDRGRGGPQGDHPRWAPGRYPHAYSSGHRFHVRPYYAPPGFYVHDWGYGEILPQAWFAPQYILQDWWDFGLPEPPYGYDWVRVGADALLVDEYSGRIMQVVRDLFW